MKKITEEEYEAAIENLEKRKNIYAQKLNSQGDAVINKAQLDLAISNEIKCYEIAVRCIRKCMLASKTRSKKSAISST